MHVSNAATYPAQRRCSNSCSSGAGPRIRGLEIQATCSEGPRLSSRQVFSHFSAADTLCSTAAAGRAGYSRSHSRCSSWPPPLRPAAGDISICPSKARLSRPGPPTGMPTEPQPRERTASEWPGSWLQDPSHMLKRCRCQTPDLT